MALRLANVNDYEQAYYFFQEYNIPFEIITRGPNKGGLRVKPAREIDGMNAIKARSMIAKTGILEQPGFEMFCDHAKFFRDAEDNTVCTFSPYHCSRVPGELERIGVTMSEYSIYGMWTRTFVLVMRNE